MRPGPVRVAHNGHVCPSGGLYSPEGQGNRQTTLRGMGVMYSATLPPSTTPHSYPSELKATDHRRHHTPPAQPHLLPLFGLGVRAIHATMGDTLARVGEGGERALRGHFWPLWARYREDSGYFR